MGAARVHACACVCSALVAAGLAVAAGEHNEVDGYCRIKPEVQEDVQPDERREVVLAGIGRAGDLHEVLPLGLVGRKLLDVAERAAAGISLLTGRP